MSAIDEKAPLLTASPHDDAREGETLALAVNQEGDLPGGEEEVTRYENKPWKYKALALLCSCLISIGSHFAAQMLGALKSTLRDVSTWLRFALTMTLEGKSVLQTRNA